MAYDIVLHGDRLPKPNNLRPGYDLNYVRERYFTSIHDFDQRNELIEIEKLYDNLSIIRFHETLQQWALRVRGAVQELLSARKYSFYHVYCLYASYGKDQMAENNPFRKLLLAYDNPDKYSYLRYHRPRIHKSQMAICFACWQLFQVEEVEPIKMYFDGWRCYGYQIKPSDLMKQHWDCSCTKAKTKDGSARIIQRAYRNHRRRPTSYCKRVWEAVRNDNTPKEKKFLGMPYHGEKKTMYSIYQKLTLRSHPVMQGCSIDENTEDSFIKQLYNQKSYSEHKRHQLRERLGQTWEKLEYMKKTNVVTLKSRNIILTSKYYDYNRVHALGNAYSNSMQKVGDLAEAYFNSVQNSIERPRKDRFENS